jgi:assimilatory nitrate reductase catalytic subunit
MSTSQNPAQPSRDTPTVISETRLQRLIRDAKAHPRFLQGVYPFIGRGLFEPGAIHPDLSYIVPPNSHAEVLYFRAGNHSDDLIYLTLLVDGAPSRYFPVGPKSDFHVALAIVEPHPAGTILDVGFAAGHGETGTVIVDVGIVEVQASELPVSLSEEAR